MSAFVALTRCRRRRGVVRVTSALTLAALLGSCVASPGRRAPGEGVVLAVRPVPKAEAAATRAVLAALDAGRTGNVPVGARRQAAALALRPASEVLVRDGAGGVISVVEPATARFHPGERVGIIKGASPGLVRWPGRAPGVEHHENRHHAT